MFLLFTLVLFFNSHCKTAIRTGAEQPEVYLQLLHNKRVGLVVNHTATVDSVHVLDFLIKQKIDVKKIFAPEHGFRGNEAAGVEFNNGIDSKTGVPVVSLYGKNKKPTSGQLHDLDVLVFDIQDVGCRFYTYISTLHYVIEACAENNVTLVVFDRPNPNGDYIAGPVLKKDFSSFVGLDPLPVVHGCTVGELANMINNEGWHSSKDKCKIEVVKIAGYNHSTNYSLPIQPSPNLPNDLAVRLYPSLCFFEATSVSIGRGTNFPFQLIGYPDPKFGDFSFTPQTIKGVAHNPIQEEQKCFGERFEEFDQIQRFTLSYFLKYYHSFENESQFLTRERWFNLLSGNDTLIKKIRDNWTEEQIVDSWKKELDEYKKLRSKYLLYKDFN